MLVRSIILYYLPTILLSFIGTAVLVSFLTNWLINGFTEQLIYFFLKLMSLGF
jgi:hypothetical protein